jgi:hypothetical protein
MNALLLTLALAGCVPGLHIQAGSTAIRQLPLDPPGRFSVTYLHSMYHVPFTEEYVLEQGSIRLHAVSSAGGTVSDYFALEGTAGEVRALARRFTSLSFLIGTTQPQILRVGTQTLSFRDLGEPGTRVVLSPAKSCGPG